MIQTATLAGGCFWCTEAIFQKLNGVIKVVSGYSGGNIENPTYEQVSSGSTNHAEVIQIEFDPQIISFDTILDVFFATHDPTTLNQQGNDHGTQYRSAIFYHSEEQKDLANKKISQLAQEKHYNSPIVTEITPFTNFFHAESYHSNFYNRNKSYPYCSIVIDPKIQKLLKSFSQLVKES
jgi:peptide-methionine (S)-S-oxide reductase